MYTKEISAMFEKVFPANPLPFLNALTEYVRENGTGSIRDDKAKMMLFTVIALSYGQLAKIDLFDEWSRLRKVYQDQHEIMTPV